MMPSRLLASLPLTVTLASKVFASFTNSAAGRACRPSVLRSDDLAHITAGCSRLPQRSRRSVGPRGPRGTGRLRCRPAPTPCERPPPPRPPRRGLPRSPPRPPPRRRPRRSGDVDDRDARPALVREHVERRLGGQQRGAEVAEHDHAAPWSASAIAGVHLVEAGADPVVVGAAGRDQPRPTAPSARRARRLRRRSSRCARRRRCPTPLTHRSTAGRVSAAARRSSAVDCAPGSRCPIERSPR